MRAAALLIALLAAAGPAWAAGQHSSQAAAARLDIIDRGQGPEAWAVNLLPGPIEVVLRATGPTPPAAEPALPARATVPAWDRALLARLARADAGLVLEAVPGHPGARPRDVEYAWPLGTRALRVGQGWGGGFSHADAENRHAVDFAAAEGTPVLAARNGVVLQVEAGFSGGGLARAEDLARANFVRILHDDGGMALYAHLAPGPAAVRPGQHVRRGERIGSVGSTGYSGGPHLHFAVQANRGLRLASIPFRMFGPAGILRFTDPGAGDGESAR